MTRRSRQRERDRALRRDREVPRRESRATTPPRLGNIMAALGKRTLAAAEALPQRPRPSDLQALPRQIVDAIRLDAHAATNAPEVEQVIGKLTRSLAAVTALASQTEVARDPSHDPDTESGPRRTHRPPDGEGAKREPADGESRSPAEELPTKANETPRDKAIEAIEAAIRRMMVTPQRGNVRAAAAAAAVGESLSEVLATVERALATELAKEDGEEIDGAGRRVDRRAREGGEPGDPDDDTSIEEGSIEDAAEAADQDRAAD